MPILTALNTATTQSDASIRTITANGTTRRSRKSPSVSPPVSISAPETISTKEDLIQAIKAKDIKPNSLREVIESFKNSTYYQIYFERMDGRKSSIKVATHRDVEEIKVIGIKSKVITNGMSFDTPNQLVDGGVAFGKEVLLSLIVPVLFGVAGILSFRGLRNVGADLYGKGLRDLVIDPKELEKQSEFVSLDDLPNRIKGVQKITSEAQRYIDNKEKWKTLGQPYQAISESLLLLGLPGCGKTSLSRAIIHDILTNDPHSIAFNLTGESPEIGWPLSILPKMASPEHKIEQFHKIAMEISSKKGVKLKNIVLFVEDPDHSDPTSVASYMRLTKAARESKKKYPDVNFIFHMNLNLTLGEIQEKMGNNTSQMNALLRRGMRHQNITDFQPEAVKTQIKCLASQVFGINEDSVPNLFIEGLQPLLGNQLSPAILKELISDLKEEFCVSRLKESSELEQLNQMGTLIQSNDHSLIGFIENFLSSKSVNNP
jgi:hypothetical protein